MEFEPGSKAAIFFENCVNAYDAQSTTFERMTDEIQTEFGDGLRLEAFTEEAAQAFTEQWEPLLSDKQKSQDRYLSARRIAEQAPNADPKFAYSRMFNDSYDPHHFNLAIWMDDTLCGLALGGHQSEIDRDYISVKVIEGNPDPNHPLKGHIGEIIDRVSTAYAQEIGVSRVAHIGRFSEGAKKMYEGRGLTPNEPVIFNPRGMQTNDTFIREIDPGL